MGTIYVKYILNLPQSHARTRDQIKQTHAITQYTTQCLIPDDGRRLV